jgi:hypothetical protein
VARLRENARCSFSAELSNRGLRGREKNSKAC